MQIKSVIIPCGFNENLVFSKEVQIKMIEIEKVFLDVNNPRFALLKKSNTNAFEFFLSRQKHRDQIEDLFKDILKVGIRYRHFLLLKESDDKYTVLDGNRRMFVLKFILSAAFRLKIKNSNSDFHLKLCDHMEKGDYPVSDILEQYKKSTYQIFTSSEEANTTLERLHSNAKEQGKVMRPWPTWETKIHNEDPAALFIFETFQKWGYTIFLETIAKHPAIHYTALRNLLNSKPGQDWLLLTKRKDNSTTVEFVSQNPDKTEKNLLLLVLYILSQPRMDANKLFYNNDDRIKTLQKINEKIANNVWVDFTQILDKLEEYKLKLEIKQIKVQENPDSETSTKKTTSRMKWFSCVEIFQEADKTSKIYKFLETINKMTEKNLKDFYLIVFTVLRPLIEMTVKNYFFKTNQQNLDNDSSDKNRKSSTFLRIKTIYWQLQKVSKQSNKVFNLEPLLALIEGPYIRSLNKMLHQNSEFNATAENTKNYLHLVDEFIKTIEDAISFIVGNASSVDLRSPL